MRAGKIIGNWLTGVAATSFMKLVRVIGRSRALALGASMGGLAYRLHSRSSRFEATLENIGHLLPDADRMERCRIAEESLRHFGRFLAESGRTPLLTQENIGELITPHGLNHLDDALAKKKGVILAWAHFGHFELGNYALALRGYPINSVIRTVDNRRIDHLLDSLREKPGQRVIKKEGASRQIVARLRQGEVVTIAYDLNAAFNNMFLPLFGELAATFTTPAIMARRTGCSVLPVFTVRDNANDHYHLTIGPSVSDIATGDGELDTAVIITRLNRVLEEAVRRDPEQWLWIHRRWKTRPSPREAEEAWRRGERVIPFL